jgi:hypothetical protein
MYIQDETAGLQFYLAENYTFAFGDKVQIDLRGAQIATYNDATQISGLALAKITKIVLGKKHPYHLVKTGTTGPYGWCDRDDFDQA